MTTVRRLLALMLLTGNAFAHDPRPGECTVFRPCPRVQLAILLDTSNSMDGLIEQAKSQLWKIVNDLAYSRRRGRAPQIEVALYEYGNDNLSYGENYVRQVLPFTGNLDEVSTQLFALRTRGGQEFCGAVIQDAVNALPWDRDDDTYKVMFIAGNEPFTQGPVPFQTAIQRAARRGITVNTIFCGNRDEGLRTQWYAGAAAGSGQFLSIDHTWNVVVDPTPYDDEIARLGSRMNDTFIPLGSRGQAVMAQAFEADAAARMNSAGGALTERSLYKGSGQYGSSDSDLIAKVAAAPSPAAALSSVRANDLPAELQGKSKKELEAHVVKLQKDRQDIQKQLADLKAKRDAHLAARAKSGQPQTLDAAMQKIIREQAGKKGFEFGK